MRRKLTSRCFFFFSSRRRHTRCGRDWSSDVCSSDLKLAKNSLLLLTPSLDTKVIRNRLKLSIDGKGISDSLNALGRFVEFRRILSRLSFSPRKEKTDSDTLEFFAARRDILGAVLELLTRFSD